MNKFEVFVDLLNSEDFALGEYSKEDAVAVIKQAVNSGCVTRAQGDKLFVYPMAQIKQFVIRPAVEKPKP